MGSTQKSVPQTPKHGASLCMLRWIDPQGRVGRARMTLPKMQKNKRIFASFVLALLVLLVAGLGAYRQGRTNVASEQWVPYTYEVLGEHNPILSLMQDVETGYRGYVISDEDSYLEPFNN